MKPHEPMLRYIRENVKMPKKLPVSLFGRGYASSLRFKCLKCPMGLLKESLNLVPSCREHFSDSLPIEFSDEKIVKFASWWDRQRDPKLAVEAVWGKK